MASFNDLKKITTEAVNDFLRSTNETIQGWLEVMEALKHPTSAENKEEIEKLKLKVAEQEGDIEDLKKAMKLVSVITGDLTSRWTEDKVIEVNEVIHSCKPKRRKVEQTNQTVKHLLVVRGALK